MTQYEQTLSKIAPTFFKLMHYNDYFIYSSLIASYLNRVGLPDVHHLDLPIKKINYFYLLSILPFKIKGKKIDMNTVTIGTKYKYNFVNIWDVLSGFIINMVINNFSFENEYDLYYSVPRSYKDFFIALVGKDMYDTIRQNIR